MRAGQTRKAIDLNTYQLKQKDRFDITVERSRFGGNCLQSALIRFGEKLQRLYLTGMTGRRWFFSGQNSIDIT